MCIKDEWSKFVLGGYKELLTIKTDRVDVQNINNINIFLLKGAWFYFLWISKMNCDKEKEEEQQKKSVEKNIILVRSIVLAIGDPSSVSHSS